MTPVRVGVIGTGRMGERHCRVYSGLRDTHLVGVVDRDHARARAVAGTYGAQAFDDAAALLREVDAISLATTTPLHYPLTVEALAAGVHVLVEKPLTETVEQGNQVAEQARSAARIVQVGHIERFNPAYLELKNVLHSGPRVVAVNVRRLSPFDASNTDVDVVRDLMIHDLDLVTDLVGEAPAHVSAMGRALTTQSTDHAVATLEFQDGPIATLCASRVTEQKIRAVEVVVDGAYIEADLLGKSVTIHRRTLPRYDDAKYQQESIIEKIHVPLDEPLMLELRHFVECIRADRPPCVTADHGLQALRLAETVSAKLERAQAAV